MITFFIVSIGWLAGPSAEVAFGSSLSYLALPPVKRWDIDVTYRFQRRDQQEASFVLGYEWRGSHEAHELALAARTRLGSRQLAVLHLPLTHGRTDGRGWRAGPMGWEPVERHDRRFVLQPVSVGWRQEASWFGPDDTEWGADAIIGGGDGWILLSRVRWLWLRDPIVLGTELALPWKFSQSTAGASGALRARLTLDHAVNQRLVVSGGVAWQGDALASLWGWSLQLKPDHYWNMQVEIPVDERGFSLQSGWRIRL